MKQNILYNTLRSQHSCVFLFKKVCIVFLFIYCFCTIGANLFEINPGEISETIFFLSEIAELPHRAKELKKKWQFEHLRFFIPLFQFLFRFTYTHKSDSFYHSLFFLFIFRFFWKPNCFWCMLCTFTIPVCV